MSRIEAKDGKESTKAEEKERKDLAKRLEPSVLCKQAKDSGLAEAEEKAKEEEKDEEKEKEKERKVVKVRKAKVKAKAKERKEKESIWEEQYAVSVIKKDIGEMSAPTDIQYETLKPKNMYQEQKLMCTIHRIRTSILDRMLSNLEVSDRQRVDRIQES